MESRVMGANLLPTALIAPGSAAKRRLGSYLGRTPRLRKLLLSIHDVTPGHADRIARLEALLGDAVRQDAAWAMLVVPEFHGKWPISADRGFRAWLRARAEAGCEMFLHGMFHVKHFGQSGSETWRERHLTAGEGEFATLSEAAARALMADGRKCLEDIIGRPPAGFIAPAWLYSAGARAAAAAEGFQLAEDHFRVWSPVSGATLARGPVVTYASRSPGRVRSSLAFSRVATTLLAPLRTVRLAVHPHDTDVPALLTEAARATRAFLSGGRVLGRYGELAGRAG